MSKFTQDLLNRITYHTSMSSIDIAFENLKKIHPSLNDDNIFALAYMATNPSIPEGDREVIKKCMQIKIDAENEKLQNFLQSTEGGLSFRQPCVSSNSIDGDICGYSNSVSYQSDSDNKT